jgi:A/G-specific adenine glycosylase
MTWFATQLLDWFDEHGRKICHGSSHAPRIACGSRSDVATDTSRNGDPYFERHAALPNALKRWRAPTSTKCCIYGPVSFYAWRNLHSRTDGSGTRRCGPADLDALTALPGIGRSTAGAILRPATASCADPRWQRETCAARFNAVDGYPAKAPSRRRCGVVPSRTHPNIRVADYTQAAMDLGVALHTQTELQRMSHLGSLHRISDERDRSLPHRVRSKRCRQTREDVSDHRRRRPVPARTSANKRFVRPLESTGTHEDYSVDALLAEVGVDTHAAVEQLDGFRHTFTHFHMDIDPIRARLDTPPLGIADGDRWLWFHPRNNQPLGLSAVAVKLLALIQRTPLLI